MKIICIVFAKLLEYDTYLTKNNNFIKKRIWLVVTIVVLDSPRVVMYLQLYVVQKKDPMSRKAINIFWVDLAYFLIIFKIAEVKGVSI